MWRRDYDDYEDPYGQYETRTVYTMRGFDPYGISVSSGSTRHPFSETEKKQLSMAVLVLSLAFAILLSGVIYNRDLWYFVQMFVISLIVAITAFALHELGHKFVAQRYGHWAEFRYNEFGLLIALVTSMMGFLFFIPGAVYISGHVTKEENGKISAAGPLTNLVMALAFWGVLFFGAVINVEIIARVGFLGAWINSFVGAFNMIPFPPLDGSKIWKWNPGVYIIMAIALVGLLLFAYGLF